MTATTAGRLNADHVRNRSEVGFIYWHDGAHRLPVRERVSGTLRELVIDADQVTIRLDQEEPIAYTLAHRHKVDVA